jgi:cyclopropane fatty-acyl-phospholipid synthase-like methyltransferase
MTASYHDVRFTEDPRRNVLWRALWRYYFSRQIAANDSVLDIGCGYGAFINEVVARRRIGIDSWPEFTRYLKPGVEGIVGSAVEVGSLVKGQVDFALASNLFEHLTQSELMRLLEGLRGLLSPKGTLTIVQPNFAYAFREYFDDYTHVSVYTHVSLSDLISANGFEVIEVQPRFLPFSIKGRLPVSEPLIRAYLASPIKPMGKQMLIRARVKS